MNEPKPKSRWFRFSLRTLFVVVTVLGIWLGLQVKWLRDRHSYLQQHPSASRVPLQTDPIASAPGLLWLLQERAETRLRVQSPGFWANKLERKKTPSIEAAEARALFPEAIIEVFEGTTLYCTWLPRYEWDWGKR